MDHQEKERIQSVRRFDRFNFDLNSNLQGILKLASDIYETPVAFITLMDETEQVFKVVRGFPVERMPRATSFCTHAIMQEATMVVTDAQTDARFQRNPLVANPPFVRFYAGASLCANDGHNVGTLCVMDVNPKAVSDEKREHLQLLAKQVIHLMELDLTYKMLNEKIQHIELQKEAFRKIAFIQSHEFRLPVANIIGLLNIIKGEQYENCAEYFQMLEQTVSQLDEKIYSVVRSTEIAEHAYLA